MGRNIVNMTKAEFIQLIGKLSEKFPPKPVLGFNITETDTGLFDCKMGGMPYFPKNMEYPVSRWKDDAGTPMKLLVQLNFEKIPHIEDFPEKGILQIFIDASADAEGNFGMCESDCLTQNSYRVIYHENIITDESQLMTPDDLPEIPVDEEVGCPFEADSEFLLEPKKPENDCLDSSLAGFDEAFIEAYKAETGKTIESMYDIEIEDEKIDWWRIIGEMQPDIGDAFIGGYPRFVQSDPRGYIENVSDCDTVLFESISTDDGAIMWCDCGTGVFLIPRENLKKLDFSKVMYSWDCC